MKFAPNTLNLFSGQNIGDQLASISRSGFEYVEILFPYLYPIEDLKALLQKNSLKISLMDVLPGDVRNLDISAACDPARVEEFRGYARLAHHVAETLDVPNINCISGCTGSVLHADSRQMMDVYRENLRYTCELFAGSGRKVLVEPVSEFQFPGYLVRNLNDAAELVEELGCPELFLQFDFFHIQLLHGNLVGNMRTFYDRIGYFQIANPPGRNQPQVGEIDFSYVLGELALLGYDGVVGLEYIPSGPDEHSFSWINTL